MKKHTGNRSVKAKPGSIIAADVQKITGWLMDLETLHRQVQTFGEGIAKAYSPFADEALEQAGVAIEKLQRGPLSVLLSETIAGRTLNTSR